VLHVPTDIPPTIPEEAAFLIITHYYVELEAKMGALENNFRLRLPLYITDAHSEAAETGHPALVAEGVPIYSYPPMQPPEDWWVGAC
jgi:hypothetical protein